MWQLFTPLIENIWANILKRGRMPRHVAFVADGARRFGRKHKIPVQENHEIGLHGVMFEVIDWCLLLGIREYSILMYAFGNYYRPKDETQHWIYVLKIWLIKCIANWRVLQKKGIRFNFYGKYCLIPTEINALMGILSLVTKNNDGIIVNMAMGYTGRHEMSTVSHHLYTAIRNGKITNSLTENVFNECLFAVENRPVDLLIRTSGFKRISDFLSWQAVDARFYFCDVLWPEFSKYDFLKAIFHYQQNCKLNTTTKSANLDDDQIVYVEELKHEYRHSLLEYCERTKYLTQNVDVQELFTLDHETIFDRFRFAREIIQW